MSERISIVERGEGAELARLQEELRAVERRIAEADEDAGTGPLEIQMDVLKQQIREAESRAPEAPAQGEGEKTTEIPVKEEVGETPPPSETVSHEPEVVAEPEEEPAPPSAEAAVTETIEEPGAAEAAVAAAVPEAAHEEKKRFARLLRTPEAVRDLGKKVGSFFKALLPKSSWKGSWKEVLAGGAAGAATRYAIRAAYGSNIWWAMGAGAAGGAVTGAVREYLHQKRVVTLESISQRFDEAKDLTEATAILAKAEELYKKALVAGSEDDLKKFGEELRQRKMLYGAEAEKQENLSEKDGVLAILKIADGARKEVPKTARKQIKELLKNIELERTEIDRKKIAGAAVRGALVGAVGGAAGGALASWLSEHIHFGGAATEEVVKKKTEAATRAVSEELQQELLAKKAEAAAAATAQVIGKAQEELLSQKFAVAAEKGEGLTHVARKLIHDYLVNQKHFDPSDFKGLSTEQLVWAEDALRRTMGTPGELAVQPEMRWEFSGGEIESVLEKARGLSEEQIKNLSELLKDPTHRLSSKTVEFMTNWEGVTTEANNFWTEAQEAATEAGRNAASGIQTAPEGMQAAVEERAAGKAASAAKEGANATLTKVLKYLGGAAVLGGAGMLAKKKGPAIVSSIKERFARGNQGKGGAVQSTLGIESPDQTSQREALGAESLAAQPEAATNTGPELAPKATPPVETKKTPAEIVESMYFSNRIPPGESQIMKQSLEKALEVLAGEGEGLESQEIVVWEKTDFQREPSLSKTGGFRLVPGMSAEEIVGFIRTNNQEAAERRLRTNEAKEKIEDFAKSLEKKDVEVITTGGEGILEVASNLSKLRDVIDRFGVDRLKGAKLYPAAGGVGSFKANNGVLHIELRENPEAIQKFLEENLPSVEQKV